MNIAQLAQKVTSVRNATTRAFLSAKIRSADLYAAKKEAEGLADCMEVYLNEIKLMAAKHEAAK